MLWTEIDLWVKNKGLPAFRAKQIFKARYHERLSSWEKSTTLPKQIKEDLEKEFPITPLDHEPPLVSSDGSEKWLFKGADGSLFEAVWMPTESRITLCISSQVGCKLGCTFCQTGKMGFKRNLSFLEMVEQLLTIERSKSSKVTHIVFMGMGEPFDNFDELLKALDLFCHPEGIGLLPRHITLSTSGLVPEIEKLSALKLNVRLAISLHGASDAVRSKLMPINKRYPLDELKKALLLFSKESSDPITFEYIMIQGENDSLKDAAHLVTFAHGLRVKVNLIPMNPHPGIDMSSSDDETLKAFQRYLAIRKIPAPIRYSRGRDVSGACGQLASKREAELLLDPRELFRKRREKVRSGCKQ